MRLSAHIISTLLLLGVLAPARANVNGSRDPRSILLRAETINVHTHMMQPERGETSTLRSSGGGQVHERTFMVHMDDAGDARQRRAVSEAAGQGLNRYVPHNTFLLDLSPEALRRTQALVGTSVVWMGELQPHHKLATAALHKLDNFLQAQTVRAAGSGTGAGAGKKAAGESGAVLVAKLRSPNAAELAEHYERALGLAGLPATVRAAGRNKLHVRRSDIIANEATVEKSVAASRGAGKPGSVEMRERWAHAVGTWLSEERDVLWVEPKARIKVGYPFKIWEMSSHSFTVSAAIRCIPEFHVAYSECDT